MMNNKQQAVGQRRLRDLPNATPEAISTDTLWCTVVHCLPRQVVDTSGKCPDPTADGPEPRHQAWETSLLTGRSTALGGSISGFSAQKTTGPRFLIL